MPSLRCCGWPILCLLVALPGTWGIALAQDKGWRQAVQVDRVIAGSPKDSLEVRHLVLRGSNEAIGRAQAEIARERFGAGPEPSRDPLRTRMQRKYFERHFPALHERMRGVAAASGRTFTDDAWNFSQLRFAELKAGCSIVYLPPGRTEAGAGIVSRDYDFSTGSLNFGPLAPGMLHPTARPYLLELHPDGGYASLSMVAYDFLGGALDGINSEGLTVTMAMDDELFSKHPVEPTDGPSVGLGVLQIMRLLLDTCGNVDEAKEALLLTKHYYEAVPVHFLIADRFGNAFMWEHSYGRNKEFIIEDPGRPLVMTNFTLSRRLEGDLPPSAERARPVCRRYAYLAEQVGRSGKFSEEMIKATHQKVDCVLPASAEPHRPPIRTFWHALYSPERRSVKFSYYLRDEPVPGRADQVKIVRSDYLEFRLDPTARSTATVVPPRDPKQVRAAAAKPVVSSAQQAIVDQLQRGGASVNLEDGRAVAVNLDKAQELSTLMPLLRQLPDLAEVTIRTKRMDDSLIKHLHGLKGITLLNLNNASVSNESMKVIASLPRLRTLNLASTQITDQGLSLLKDMTQLEILTLWGNAVTDDGLAQLAGLTNIMGLNLGKTKVTDVGLEHLRGMRRLTKLTLTGTAVTDDGLAKAKKHFPFFITVIRDK